MEETCPREEEEEEEEEWVIDHERIAKWRRWARYGVIVGAILNRAITYGLYYGSGVLLLPFLCRFHAGRAATGKRKALEIRKTDYVPPASASPDVVWRGHGIVTGISVCRDGGSSNS